jgi:hypothetical protein
VKIKSLEQKYFTKKIIKFLYNNKIHIASKYSFFKMLLVNLYKDWILIRVVETYTYYVLSFMKRNSCSHKLRYEEYPRTNMLVLVK